MTTKIQCDTCRPHKEICPTCHGEGVSVAYLGAYTAEDREEMGEEWYQFADDVRAGLYDRPCHECDGTNVVDVHEHSCETWREELECRAMLAAELRFGC